uniref:DNA 3'-5' helicase n=1 Tax=uncultured marine group II/III euryarchaeote SAT1000_33_E05 TaxID=1456575 RepID=A0A075IEJ2_9EURY|nr:TPR repeat-containing protein [uncultured marine group II/III euryarchaeote SAT1000_33_E05]
MAIRDDGRHPFRGLKVIVTPRVRKWFENTNPELRKRAFGLIKRMRDSMEGSLDGIPKIGRVKSLKGVEVPIYEARVTADIRLLYNVQKKKKGNPVLMLLDLSDHDYLSRTAGRSADHLVHASRLDGLRWDDEEIVLDQFPLESPRIHNSSDEIIGNNIWDKLDDGKKRDYRLLEGKELDNELKNWINGRDRVIGPEDLWTKEYTEDAFKGATIYTIAYPTASKEELEAHQLEMIKNGKLHPHLSLDDSQMDLVSEDSQVFILEGVAGTGKTTILERRFIRYIEEGQGAFATSVFLTHSKALAESVKTRIKQYFSERESAEIDGCIMDLESWCKEIILKGRRISEINEKEKDIEEKRVVLDSLKEKERELYLIEQLSRWTNKHQSASNDVEKVQTEIEEEERGLEELVKKDSTVDIQITDFSPEKKLGYSQFTQLITEIGGTKIDSGILWEEYRGVILGAGVDDLNENDYVGLSRDRVWSRNKKLRREAYQEISKITKRIERRNGDVWTDQHIAKYVSRYSEENDGELDAIFVDEIQDLTELQVSALLNNLKKNGHGKFEVAGDTSQSVHPSAFRWEDLRRAISEILEIKMPKHHKMNTNYRATPYLIKSANLFLEEHDKILGINSDELQRPAAKDNGIHPCVIRLNESEIISALAELGLPNAFCPLVVREDSEVSRFRKILGTDGNDNVHILSVRGSKGLEYENVILWDIFSGSSRLLDNYHHHIRGKEHSKKKEGLAIELRHVFVGITRARYRLAMVSPQTDSEHVIESAADWLQTKDDLFTVEELSFLNEFTKKDATQEDYLTKAEEFESSGRWEMAADAYRSAGKDLDMHRCRGKYLQEDLQFEEAASAFQKASNEAGATSNQEYMVLEAECLDLAIGLDSTNMELLEHRARISTILGDDDARSRTLASICESRAAITQGEARNRHWQLAAMHWRGIGEIEKAVKIHVRLGEHSKAAIDSLKLNEPLKSKFFSKAIEQILKNKDRQDLIFDMYNGGKSWREQVAKALGLKVNKIPIIEKDTDQAIKYAEGDQKLELELSRARDSGNWRNEAGTLLKMKRTDEAVDLYIEKAEYVSALYATLRNYDDSMKGYLQELVPEIIDIPGGRDVIKNSIKKQENIVALVNAFPIKLWMDLADEAQAVGKSDYFWQVLWLRDVSGLRRIRNKEIFHPIEDRTGRSGVNPKLMDGIDSIIDTQLFLGNLERVSEVCNFGLNYIQYISEWSDGKYSKEISKSSNLLKTIWYITKATELCGEDLGSMKKINEKWLIEFFKAMIQNERWDYVMHYWRMSSSKKAFRKFTHVNKLISAHIRLNIVPPNIETIGLTNEDFIACNYEMGQLITRIGNGDYPRVRAHRSKELTGVLDHHIGENNVELILHKGPGDIANLERGIPSSKIKPPPQELTEEIAGWIRPVEVPLRVEGESWLDKISGAEIKDHIELKSEIEVEIIEDLPEEGPEEEPVELDLAIPEFEDVSGSKYNLNLQTATDAIISEKDPVLEIKNFIYSEVSEEEEFEILEFIELRDEWDESIDQQWASSGQFIVELLACKQALIDITKEKDKFEKYKYSLKTLDEQNRRTRDNYRDISLHKFIVSNRWMSN